MAEREEYKVLLVEDNPGDAFLVKTLLRKIDPHRFRLITADSVESAWERLAGDPRPEIVLLDLNLPDSIGEETFSKIFARCAGIPVVVFTGLGETELSQRLLDRGAYAFVSKDEMTEGVLFNTIYACLKRRESESELLRLKGNAERADQEKTKFLGHMSHELRTPLTAILGYTDILLNNPSLSMEQTTHLGRVQNNSRYLQTLVNDLLDLSKIELGKFEAEPKACRLNELLDDVFTTLKVKADEEETTLVCRTDGTIPRTVIIDPTRLKQILLNIVGNASKFTKRGTVDVCIGARSERSGWRVQFKVTDQGPGIREEQMKELFKPYSKVHPASEKRQGAGLGLALSRALANHLRGDVRLASSSPSGSTFHIDVFAEASSTDRESIAYQWPPQTPQTAPAKRSRFGESLSGVQVLVVEDVRDLSDLYDFILSKCGAHVTKVDTGTKGIETALAHSFDVLLLDLSLPDMDGMQVTRTLRSKGYTKPIVALTAHALPEVRQRALDAGFSCYLTKPVNPTELTTVLSQITNSGADVAASARAAGPRA